MWSFFFFFSFTTSPLLKSKNWDFICCFVDFLWGYDEFCWFCSVWWLESWKFASFYLFILILCWVCPGSGGLFIFLNPNIRNLKFITFCFHLNNLILEMKFCPEYLMIVCRVQVSSRLVLLIYFLKTFVVDGLSSKNLISLIVLLLIRIIFIFVLNTNSYFIYLVLLVIYALLFQSMSIQTQFLTIWN